MNQKEFIQKWKDSGETKSLWQSSILYSGGAFYSYGQHYPLLFKVKGLWFVNTRGYSATTGKHIGYAKQAADYCVKLKGNDFTVSDVLNSLSDEALQLKTEFFKLTERGKNGRIGAINRARLEMIKKAFNQLKKKNA